MVVVGRFGVATGKTAPVSQEGVLTKPGFPIGGLWSGRLWGCACLLWLVVGALGSASSFMSALLWRVSRVRPEPS